jgi:hypothetical protein
MSQPPLAASAEGLDALHVVLRRAEAEASVRRRSIEALVAEAGDGGAVPATLASLQSWLAQSASRVQAAARVAEADRASAAPSSHQTGWRSTMGLVDDFVFEVFWVNDIHRLATGRDLNTGTDVGGGGRFMSAVGLIPVTKLLKIVKVARFGDEAADVAGAASPSARTALSVTRSLDDLSTLRGATPDEIRRLIPEDWTAQPLRHGRGTRWHNPSRRGEAIMLEEGWPNARDAVHAGPYVRISRNGDVHRIPLAGSPALEP